MSNTEVWQCKSAVLRDLSKITRGRITSKLHKTVIGDDKPVYEKEVPQIEDESLKYYTGENLKEPDLHSIQNMISLVKGNEGEGLEDDGSSFSGILEPLMSSSVVRKPKTKPKRMRNAAMESLLINSEEQTPNLNPGIKLLKPNDIIAKEVPGQQGSTEISKSVEKVNNWMNDLDYKTEPVQLPFLADSSMFKLSSSSKQMPSTSSQNGEGSTSSGRTDLGSKIPNWSSSKAADDILKKMKEMVEVRDALKKDLWEKAQIKMKEMEEQRKLDMALVPLTLDNGTELYLPNCLILTQHRHESNEKCVVCEVMKVNVEKEPTNDVQEEVQES